MGYAFLSYSTKNQAYADAMRTLFNKHNIDTWMAPYDIPAGSKYAAVITRSIRECACFVLLLSNDSQASDAVDSEVELATLTFKKSIIIVELEKVLLNDAFTFYLHNKQIIAVHEIKEESNEMQQILRAVKAYTGEAETPVPAAPVHTPPRAYAAAPSGAPSIQPSNGRMVLDGRYELTGKVGEGTLGVSYKALDLMEQKNVVVRVGKIASEYSVKLHRFLMGKTNENLCKVVDASTSLTGEAYIVLEWNENKHYLSSSQGYRKFFRKLEGNYPAGAHISVLIDLLKGLGQLHSLGIIHGNVTPDHILSDGHTTKLCDYHDAFFAGDGRNPHATDILIFFSRFSNSEKMGDSIVDCRSDLYSVGMVAFWWLTGQKPAVNKKGRLSFDNVKIDNEAMLILQKATAPNPNDRYQTADAFIADLEKYRSWYCKQGMYLDA